MATIAARTRCGPSSSAGASVLDAYGTKQDGRLVQRELAKWLNMEPFKMEPKMVVDQSLE